MDSFYESSSVSVRQSGNNANQWRQELDTYLSSKRAEKGTDILNWWKNHELFYPNLAKMARDYLSIQATSVASERVFFKKLAYSAKA